MLCWKGIHSRMAENLTSTATYSSLQMRRQRHVDDSDPSHESNVYNSEDTSASKAPPSPHEHTTFKPGLQLCHQKPQQPREQQHKPRFCQRTQSRPRYIIEQLQAHWSCEPARFMHLARQREDRAKLRRFGSVQNEVTNAFVRDDGTGEQGVLHTGLRVLYGPMQFCKHVLTLPSSTLICLPAHVPVVSWLTTRKLTSYITS